MAKRCAATIADCDSVAEPARLISHRRTGFNPDSCVGGGAAPHDAGDGVASVAASEAPFPNSGADSSAQNDRQKLDDPDPQQHGQRINGRISERGRFRLADAVGKSQGGRVGHAAGQ